MTPLAKDELNGPQGEGYRRMIEAGPAGRAGWRRDGLLVVWRTRAAINKSGAATPMTGISKSGLFQAHKNSLGIAYETDTTV